MNQASERIPLFYSSSKWLFLLFLSLLFQSCFYLNSNENTDTTIHGLKPIYMDKAEAQKIEVFSPKPLNNPGKIYVFGNLLFINELHSGIHIINNADPENPVPLSFIKIYGNVDIAIKSGNLYADNAGDLVILNINDLSNIQLVKRVDNVFPSNNFPSQTGVYFECADPAKGMVVGWESTILETITCRR